MAQSLSSSLDELSKKQKLLIPERKIFTTEFIGQWAAKSQELCSQFKQLESNDEREKWLRDIFHELLDIMNEQVPSQIIQMPNVSKLIEDLISGGSKGLTSQEVASMVGKMFVSVTHQSPHIDDNKLVALARITSSLQKELFKFSRISTKLLNNEQKVLLKHLLKKSKYELKKFNLIGECTGGYSQLLMLLVTAYNDVDKMQKIPYYLKQLYHISGKYSLDPMRTLDIVLQVSSDYITEHYMFLIGLLKRSAYWPHGNPANSDGYDSLDLGGNMMASSIIVFNLARDSACNDLKYLDMVCILIKYGFVNFISIWDNVGPDNESLQKLFTQFEEDLEAESMKGASNPLAMAAALASGEENESKLKTDEKDSELQLADGMEGSPPSDQSSSMHKGSSSEILIGKGKAQILERLLAHGCTVPAFYVLNLWPKFVQLKGPIPIFISRIFGHMIRPLYQYMVFSAPHSLGSALLNTRVENGLISHKVRLIEEIKTHNPFTSLDLHTRSTFYFQEWSESLAEIHSVDDLFKKSHEILSILGTCIAKNPKLVTEICRIGIADIHENPEVTDKWIDYTRKFIFPAIPSLGTNPTVATEIYCLMKVFPFEKRYFVYNEMLTKLSQDDVPIKLAFNKSARQAKGMLKALSVDNIEQESRRLAKLASTNPLAVLIPAVKQIENYDKVSELVVFSAKYFNDFAYDVLQYVLLLRLTNGNTAVQSDGVNQAMWVQRLSVFIADLAKNCRKMDINNIITYIVKTLHQGNIIAISLMRELITKVGGIRDLNEVNLKQLKMLNSGEPLRRVARKLIFDSRDENNKLAAKILDLFSKQNSVSEVILLLYRLNLQANSQESHYKILSSRCDEMNTLLWAFIELVKHCFKAQNFRRNVLPFDSLNNEYHVSTPWVFHIWRDYIEEESLKGDNYGSEMLQNATFEEVDFAKMSKELFLTFWKLTLYDIQFDKNLYEERRIYYEEERAAASSARTKNEFSNNLKEVLGSCLSHQKIFNQNANMFKDRAPTWKKSFSDNGSLPFFQHCIIPRVLFSPADALYSAFFLKTFDITYLLSIFGNFVHSEVLGTLLFCCTRMEAGNLGIFYRELLGSLEDLRDAGQLDETQRRQLYQLHCIINKQLIETICNKNYMSIRNGIEFMKHLSLVFPVVDSQIELVCVALEENLETEQREDIKLPSNALLGHLKARLKKSMKLHDYCNLNEAEKEDQGIFESELDEIKQYELLLSNEKKQAELRKKLELNKKQREESEKAKQESGGVKSFKSSPISAIPKGPLSDRTVKQANDNLPSVETISKFIDEICTHLKSDRIDKVLTSVKNGSEGRQLRDLLKVYMPIHDLRNSLYEILERYFRSSYPTNNADVDREIESLKKAVEYITRDGIKRCYDDSSAVGNEGRKRGSRYNSSVADKSGEPQLKNIPSKSNKTAETVPKASSRQYSIRSFDRDTNKLNTSSRFSTNNKRSGDSREQTAEEQRRKPYYTNRQNRVNYEERNKNHEEEDRVSKAFDKSVLSIPSAPRALAFPDRPSSAKRDSRPMDRKPTSSNSYRNNGSQSSGNRRTQDHPETEERPFKKIKTDEKRYDFSRQVDKTSVVPPAEQRDRSRYNKDLKNQRLPQGPKSSGEPSSRYQR